MEYIDGYPLSDIIKPDIFPELDLIVDIIIQVCDAMSHAHEESIIHRDLKPGNIMLEKDKDVKITDFGIAKMIEDGNISFREKGYTHGTAYLVNLSERLFTNIELWLKTGVIAPKTTSLLERVFREIGRRLKRIAWGWADKSVTNLSKMIMIRQYSRDKWEKYWKYKLGINGHFEIKISSVVLSPCEHF